MPGNNLIKGKGFWKIAKIAWKKSNKYLTGALYGYEANEIIDGISEDRAIATQQHVHEMMPVKVENEPNMSSNEIVIVLLAIIAILLLISIILIVGGKYIVKKCINYCREQIQDEENE